MISAYLLWLTTQVPAPPEVPVRWTAPAECPDRDALLVAVARRLGRPLADEARVDGRVTGDRSRGYVLHLELSAGGRGEVRDVQDPSCAALAEAAALRVVAAIEAPVVPPVPVPEPAEPGPEPQPGPDPQPGPEEAVVPAEPVRTVALPTPAAVREDMYDGPGGVLRLQGGLELGAFGPAPAGAVGLAVGLLWPRLRVELQGTVLPPRRMADVTAGLYAGAIHGCWRAGRGALEVPLCGGVEVGGMRGRAADPLPGAVTRTQAWVAGILGPGLAWHVSSRVSVWASLQLVLAVYRPLFVQGDPDGNPRVLLAPSAASGRLLLGVELRLGDRWQK